MREFRNLHRMNSSDKWLQGVSNVADGQDTATGIASVFVQEVVLNRNVSQFVEESEL